tara:strand:+ start:1737 stop:2594 length:858 start_codon:yes stop_codon:yes gene_type:complete
MIGYYLAIGFGKLISFLPFRLLYLFSDFLKFLMQNVLKYRKEVIEENLKKSFPEKSEKEIEKLRSGFYSNFADILVESFKSLSVSRKTMEKRFVLKNPELFQNLYNQDQGLIMVMGHYTNFEWTAMCIPLCVPNPCFAVYQPLKNKRFSKKIVWIREQFGLKLFPMEETYPFMLNNKAKAPLYVFMADQSPHKGKIKYRSPFLNRNTPVHLGVENLSKKCNLAVIFIEVERVKRGFYEVEAKLLFDKPNESPEHEITDTHVQALEKLIRKKPEDWLWSHKRWKHA